MKQVEQEVWRMRLFQNKLFPWFSSRWTFKLKVYVCSKGLPGVLNSVLLSISKGSSCIFITFSKMFFFLKLVLISELVLVAAVETNIVCLKWGHHVGWKSGSWFWGSEDRWCHSKTTVQVWVFTFCCCRSRSGGFTLWGGVCLSRSDCLIHCGLSLYFSFMVRDANCEAEEESITIIVIINNHSKNIGWIQTVCGGKVAGRRRF